MLNEDQVMSLGIRSDASMEEQMKTLTARFNGMRNDFIQIIESASELEVVDSRNLTEYNRRMEAQQAEATVIGTKILDRLESMHGRGKPVNFVDEVP